MFRYDFRSPRLYLDAPLAPRQTVDLDRSQANYLANVLRLKSGDSALVFNGRDGEWRAELAGQGKRLSLNIDKQTREQTRPLDLQYVFAPLKHQRLDYMVQKAVELGVSRLQPAITRHVQVTRINVDRMRANVIEAAEQCGIISLPEVFEPVSLDQWLGQREPDRLLVFCDEDAEVKDPVTALERHSGGPLAVLVGPEGGFSEDERAMLLRQPNVARLSLGPRILRADTAAVAALTIVQAVLGDWR
jgi:16S rRNA (uracil1498-N3)-methyltransferase